MRGFLISPKLKILPKFILKIYGEFKNLRVPLSLCRKLFPAYNQFGNRLQLHIAGPFVDRADL